MLLRLSFIPASVSEIDETAFYQASKLAKIDVATGNKNYSSLDSVLYNADKTKLLYCPTLKKRLTIPASVEEISDYAIDSFSTLEWIEVENGNKNFCSVNGILYTIDKKKLLIVPPKIKEVEFAPTLTEISDNALEGSSIQSVELPASIKRIGNNAFRGCSLLKGVKIMSNAFSIGNGAFSNCKSLTTVTVTRIYSAPRKEPVSDESSEDNSDKETYTIGDEAFYNCWALTSLQLPDSVSVLGNNVFNSCMDLTSISLPNSIDSIGERAFYNCPALTSIEGLDSVKSIGKEAFSRCSALKNVRLGDSLKVLRESLFAQCSALDSIVIPNGVEKIETNAFHFCNSLSYIKFGSSLETIERYAFEGCDALTEFDVSPESETFSTYRGVLYDVDKTILQLFPPAKTECVLPETVTSITDNDYTYFSNLRTMVSFAEEVPVTGYNTFNMVRNGVLYVPMGCKAKYQDSQDWRRFSEIYEMGSIEVALSDSTIEMTQGENLAVQPNVTKDENVTVGSTSWTSSNPEVATVKDGDITAVGEGEAIITYTVNVNYGEVELPYTASCLVKIAPTQGVISIEGATSAPAIYYNLNGMRVDGESLAPGIYVKRQGNQVNKVYVK